MRTTQNFPFTKNKKKQPVNIRGEQIQNDLAGPTSRIEIDTLIGLLALRPIPSKHTAIVVNAQSEIIYEMGVPRYRKCNTSKLFQ